MNDSDLEKFSFDNLDTTLNEPKQSQGDNTAFSNTAKDSTPSNKASSNRPRLRKIKRPKQHSGPIGASNTFGNNPRPSTTNYSPNPVSTGLNTGLVRASQASNLRSEQINRNNMVNYPSTYVDNYAQDEENVEYPVENGNGMKKLVIISVICLLVGVLMGKTMFSSEQVVRNGLQGVIVNPEVPKGRGRCGVVEKTQGCVLYIMNPQRQELNGRDFYDLASQLTGRQRFVIETGNMRYSSVKIKPGNIAQLNIPPLN